MARSTNGRPEPYQIANGRWRVAVQRGAGSRVHRSRVFLSGSSEDEVRRRRDDWLRAQEEGRRPPDRRLTTGTYLRRWLDSIVVRERTAQSYRATIENHVLPYVGQILLAQLGPLDIDEMLTAQVRRGVHPPTRAYSVRVIKIALNVAVRRKRLIPFNPVDGADQVAVKRREPTILTVDQARTLLRTVANDRLGPFFTLLATTGLRRGEALALVWQNWDREAGTILVERTLLYRPGVGFERVEPKTKRSVRTLRLPAVAQAALRDQSRRQAEERLRIGRRWHNEDLVFTGEQRQGGALSGATVGRALHRLCDVAEVPRVRVHDLRHLYATVLSGAALSDPVRMAVMGHSSRSMTDLYSRPEPTSLEAADAIDAVFGLAVDASVDAIGRE